MAATSGDLRALRHVAVFVVFIVTLVPLLVAGMREILAEPATGPVRLPSIRRRSR
jgi:hypothetical protein